MGTNLVWKPGSSLGGETPELRNLEKICHNMNRNGDEEAEAIEAARERLPAGAEGQK